MAVKPRLLDLFCGVGGAGMGYARAGFDVVGVDIKPQPDYPFEFHQADAIAVMVGWDAERLAERGWDAVHASPPCKRWTALAATSAREHPDLLTPTRMHLQDSGLPYVIENVVGAPLDGTTMLCGTMFDLGVFRHRYFESGLPMPLVLHPPHGERVGDGQYFSVVGTGGGMHKMGSRMVPKGTTEQWQHALGIDWTTSRGALSVTIPCLSNQAWDNRSSWQGCEAADTANSDGDEPPSGGDEPPPAHRFGGAL